MADEKQQPKVLKGEEALALARQGKDVWNAWAEDHPDWAVIFFRHNFKGEPISFEDFVFPGNAIFEDCTFGVMSFSGAEFRGGDARFSSAGFMEGVWFSGAIFSGGWAEFNDCLFSGTANFDGSEFHAFSSFEGSDFRGAFQLDGAEFNLAPELRYTQISRHFTLHGVSVDFATSKEGDGWFGWFQKASDIDDSDRFRRLKELAKKAENHESEQDFFAKELKAKRFYETRGAALVWSYLYEWASDFGRSMYRPLVGLYASTVLFGFVYWAVALFSAGGRDVSLDDVSLDNGLKLSLSVLLPFVAAARTVYGEAKEALFGAGTGLLLDILVVFEGIIGLAFVFLIGLALRNRFRI